MYASAKIASGSFVCEYIGEIISSEASKSRLKSYDARDKRHALLVRGCAISGIEKTSCRLFVKSCRRGRV